MRNLQRYKTPTLIPPSSSSRRAVEAKPAAALTAAALLLGIVGMGTTTASAQETTPQPIVSYDFSTAANGTTAVANDVENSLFGDAVVTDSDGETAGRYEEGALQMEGSYYVKLPDDILKDHASATISTVVRNDEFNSSGSQWTYLWSLGGTGQTAKGSWAASTHTSLYTSITSKENGAGETFFSASENLSMDEFQTFTATIDGTTNTVTLYINGREVGSSPVTTNPAQFGDHTHNVIGESRYPGVGDAYYHGAIKMFTVYDGAMTQQQIAQTLPTDGVADLLDSQASAIDVPAYAKDDFTLPNSTRNATVAWESSDETVIRVDNATGEANVTPQPQDTAVTLTATLTPLDGMSAPAEPVSREFTVTVPRDVTEDELREIVAANVVVDNPDDVRGSLLLPATVRVESYDVDGTVSWVSSDPDTLAIEPLAEGSASYTTVVTRPSCGNARAVTLTATISSDTFAEPIVKTLDVMVQPSAAGDDPTHTRVTSHDPGIIKANGKYYIFGSHRAFAKSTDLQHWEYFTNNLVTDYQSVLGDIWEAWPKQDTNPDLAGNMWAPEVVWNPTMNKWCMYLSINGGGAQYQKTVMVLLTADDIEGDWTYVGPVIYSGFNADNADQTDVYRVLGEGADLSRYDSLQDTGINAIDASVKYDGDDMWMALGSWFGGIWMIKLDPTTGLRDYTTTYETVPNVSDAYYGHKLAGGYGNSGEGVALTKQGDYWYMFLSYGGLTQTGGYQMREFRSEHITGPYVDQNGNSAVYTQGVSDDKAFNRGLRILSSYNQTGSENIKTAQGGNAILTDDDGSIYNVFHTRFVRTEGNLEEHQVRVQPMVVSPDGWLVMAPYEKSGTVRQQDTYTTEQVAGDYEIVVHNPIAFYAGGGDSSDAIYHAQTVTLNADGTISGAATGSWNVDGTTVSMTIGTAEEGSLLHGSYTATLGTQTTETGDYAMFFTGVGGDVFPDAGPDAQYQTGRVAFWGTKAIDPPTAEVVPCPTDPTDPDDSGQSPDPDSPIDQSGQNNPNNQAGDTNETKPLAQSGSATVPVLFAAMVAITFGGACAFARRKRR